MDDDLCWQCGRPLFRRHGVMQYAEIEVDDGEVVRSHITCVSNIRAELPRAPEGWYRASPDNATAK